MDSPTAAASSPTAAVPAKRGRGRPPKTADGRSKNSGRPRADPNAEPSAASPRSPVKSEYGLREKKVVDYTPAPEPKAVAANGEKRGRGRPPGSGSSAASKIKKVKKAKKAPVVSGNGEKRGRGRPKKVVTEEVQDEDDEEEQEEEEEDDE